MLWLFCVLDKVKLLRLGGGESLAAASSELYITSLDEAGFEDIYGLVLEDGKSTRLKYISSDYI